MFNSMFQSGGHFPHYSFLNHCYRIVFLTVHLYSHYLKVVATFTKPPEGHTSLYTPPNVALTLGRDSNNIGVSLVT